MRAGSTEFRVTVAPKAGEVYDINLLAPTPESAANLAERDPLTGYERGTATGVTMKLVRLGTCTRCGGAVLGQPVNGRLPTVSVCGAC